VNFSALLKNYSPPKVNSDLLYDKGIIGGEKSEGTVHSKRQ